MMPDSSSTATALEPTRLPAVRYLRLSFRVICAVLLLCFLTQPWRRVTTTRSITSASSSFADKSSIELERLAVEKEVSSSRAPRVKFPRSPSVGFTNSINEHDDDNDTSMPHHVRGTTEDTTTSHVDTPLAPSPPRTSRSSISTTTPKRLQWVPDNCTNASSLPYPRSDCSEVAAASVDADVLGGSLPLQRALCSVGVPNTSRVWTSCALWATGRLIDAETNQSLRQSPGTEAPLRRLGSAYRQQGLGVTRPGCDWQLPVPEMHRCLPSRADGGIDRSQQYLRWEGLLASLSVDADSSPQIVKRVTLYGDSVVRQLFLRMVRAIRSSIETEESFFAEHYFQSDASYTLFDNGTDSLVIHDGSPESGPPLCPTWRFGASGSAAEPPAPLLYMCYTWDPTNTRLLAGGAVYDLSDSIIVAPSLHIQHRWKRIGGMWVANVAWLTEWTTAWLRGITEKLWRHNTTTTTTPRLIVVDLDLHSYTSKIDYRPIAKVINAHIRVLMPRYGYFSNETRPSSPRTSTNRSEAIPLPRHRGIVFPYSVISQGARSCDGVHRTCTFVDRRPNVIRQLKSPTRPNCSCHDTHDAAAAVALLRLLFA